MEKLERLLEREGHLETLNLINQGIEEEDVVNLCEIYGLTKKTTVKGSSYMIQFYKDGQLVQEFKQLFSKAEKEGESCVIKSSDESST